MIFDKHIKVGVLVMAYTLNPNYCNEYPKTLYFSNKRILLQYHNNFMWPFIVLGAYPVL